MRRMRAKVIYIDQKFTLFRNCPTNSANQHSMPFDFDRADERTRFWRAYHHDLCDFVGASSVLQIIKYFLCFY